MEANIDNIAPHQQQPRRNPSAGCDADDHVARLRSLLGDRAVLISVPHACKGPRVKGWQKLSVSVMEDPGYLLELGRGNIGVLLGNPSSGIVSLDCDTDEAVEEFAALNPALQVTLQSCGHRGRNLWFMMDGGEYPKSSKITRLDGTAIGEWRADGNQTIIHGTHPTGCRYRIIVERAPVVIKFADIKWPEEWVVPWRRDAYEELVAHEGEPFQLSKNGSVILNQPFFVARFARERLICFDSTIREFVEYREENGLWVTVTEDAVAKRFSDDLKKAAEQLDLSRMETLRTNRLLRDLVSLMKGHGECEFPTMPNRVLHLANGMLHLGADRIELTVFSPDYHSRNQSPIKFDETAGCPRFLDELLGPALPTDDIKLVQKMCGMFILGRNLIQRFLILTGIAGSGKGILGEIIDMLVGIVNVAQLRTRHLGRPFEIFGFVGRTLLCGRDVPGNFLSEKDAHIIKTLVGGDRLTAEKKNGNVRVQLVGNFNLFVTCNARLRINLDDDASAWRRRLLIVPYEKRLDPPRPAGFSTLLIEQEGSGILNWAIEGLYQLFEDIRQIGDVRLTKEQHRRIESLLGESDSISEFVRNRVVAAPGVDVTTEEILHGYYEYCLEMRWIPRGIRMVQTSLEDLLLQIHRVGKRHDISRVVNGLCAIHNGFSGVTLKKEAVYAA